MPGERLLALARARRSVRVYRSDPIDLKDLFYAIETALQAPSGANQQPWTYVIVVEPELKERIRKACENAEKKFYSKIRGGLKKWLREKGLSWSKPFLTQAPVLLAVFTELGKPYTVQSTWLAIGYLILALEERGLASLTYTPPNPDKIREMLGAPRNHVLQALIPVGYPADKKNKEPRKPLNQAVYLNKWGGTFNS